MAGPLCKQVKDGKWLRKAQREQQERFLKTVTECHLEGTLRQEP